LNLIGGVLAPDNGEILRDGAPIQLRSPGDATACGIGVVHQHFMLVPVFSIAENVALHAARCGVFFKAAEWVERVGEWAHSLGWKIDGKRRVAELSVGERQRVEIIKALFTGAGDARDGDSVARLLLLDEPTANLTPAEVEELFAVLRRLREQGRGVVFVSHKLNEVLSLCDRIVVLRNGHVVGSARLRRQTRRS
jgi:simple sugar transport system ATP-binding protein